MTHPTPIYAELPKPAGMLYETTFAADVETPAFIAAQLHTFADETHALRTRDGDYIQVRAEDLRAMLTAHAQAAPAAEAVPVVARHRTKDDILHFLTKEQMVEEIIRLDAALAAAPTSKAAPAGETEPEILCWVPEDELPESITSEAYDALFPHSRVDGVRLFPVFGPPTPATKAAPVAQGDAEDAARLRFLIALMESAKGSASLTVNDHLSVYEQATPGEEVLLHWYPDSPVGFYEATGSTVREVIDSVRSQQGSKNV